MHAFDDEGTQQNPRQRQPARPPRWADATVLGRDGNKLGSVGQVHLDDATGRPDWVTVKTDCSAPSETFVPLQEASIEGDTLRVPYDKDTVKDAPRVDADSHLTPDQEEELYRYYGLSSSSGTTGGDATGTWGTTTGSAGGAAGTVGHDTRGRDTTGHDTSGSAFDTGLIYARYHTR